MKFLYPLLASLLISASSFAMPIPSLVKDQVLLDHIHDVQRAFGLYCNNDPEVLVLNKVFLVELERSYHAGEGMIDQDIHHILDAICFAAHKHQFQTRKNGRKIPYIIHPIGVAHNLLLIGKIRDPDIIIAALLHDTVEDTDTTFEEIKEKFGKRVTDFVREVTDDKSLPKKKRKELQIINAPHKSAGAAQIKLGDKLENLKDLSIRPIPDWSKERADAYFEWACKVVNGLPWVNASLKQAVDETIEGYWQCLVA